MRPVTIRTDEELAYAITDCQEAIKANPTIASIAKYGQEIGACEQEQTRRASKRFWRRRSFETGLDPLTYHKSALREQCYSRRYIRSKNANAYEIDQHRTATWMLGSFRRFPALYSRD